jgi:hypothetical protein
MEVAIGVKKANASEIKCFPADPTQAVAREGSGFCVERVLL